MKAKKILAAATLLTLTLCGCTNDDPVPAKANVQASQISSTSSNPILSFEFTQSPISATWQIATDLQANYELQICVAATTPSTADVCTPYLDLTCIGQITCIFSDPGTGNPRYDLELTGSTTDTISTYTLTDPATASLSDLTQPAGTSGYLKIVITQQVIDVL